MKNVRKWLGVSICLSLGLFGCSGSEIDAYDVDRITSHNNYDKVEKLFCKIRSDPVLTDRAVENLCGPHRYEMLCKLVRNKIVSPRYRFGDGQTLLGRAVRFNEPTVTSGLLASGVWQGPSRGVGFYPRHQGIVYNSVEAMRVLPEDEDQSSQRDVFGQSVTDYRKGRENYFSRTGPSRASEVDAAAGSVRIVLPECFREGTFAGLFCELNKRLVLLQMPLAMGLVWSVDPESRIEYQHSDVKGRLDGGRILYEYDQGLTSYHLCVLGGTKDDFFVLLTAQSLRKTFVGQLLWYKARTVDRVAYGIITPDGKMSLQETSWLTNWSLQRHCDANQYRPVYDLPWTVKCTGTEAIAQYKNITFRVEP